MKTDDVLEILKNAAPNALHFEKIAEILGFRPATINKICTQLVRRGSGVAWCAAGTYAFKGRSAATNITIKRAEKVPPAQAPEKPREAARVLTPIAMIDLRDFEDGPRVRDMRLGERLGFSRPVDIRKLVDRNIVELKRYGAVRHDVVPLPQGGPPATEYWLNEEQACLLVMFSRTDYAADARQEIISVYAAWRQGKLGSRPESSALEKITVVMASMVEGQNQILKLLTRTPMRQDAVTVSPDRFDGDIVGTRGGRLKKLAAGVVTQTKARDIIAQLIQWHTGPGGYTIHKQKNILELLGIITDWESITIDASEMLIPITGSGYAHWFGAYVHAQQVVSQDLFSGRQSWQWCFTDAGIMGLKELAPQIKKLMDAAK